jgi:DNA-3-methyladenine glycosylase I
MAGDPKILNDANGFARCWWCGTAPDYVAYHDHEWGFPVTDDRRLFEKICLEGFQSGLSWLTILRKRENFRSAFAGFDYEKVARFNTRSVQRLLGDAGIVRHRGKIESTINNARRACDLADETGGLSAYFWRFEIARPANAPVRIVPSTAESAALSKDLKKRGWTFVGPTTAYAFMQAMGLTNDHLHGCRIRPLVSKARRRL